MSNKNEQKKYNSNQFTDEPFNNWGLELPYKNSSKRESSSSHQFDPMEKIAQVWGQGSGCDKFEEFGEAEKGKK